MQAAVDRPPPSSGMKLGLVVLRSALSFTFLVCFLYHEKIMVGGVEEVMSLILVSVGSI